MLIINDMALGFELCITFTILYVWRLWDGLFVTSDTALSLLALLHYKRGPS